ncbi:MAG: hypothetical protein Ct9H300mP26_3220 [Acidimicrobiales bacterium]|nr:MAG: hypothetical protein Ct9H300mP26_3220 [Acidimicrobiales bacterium]
MAAEIRQVQLADVRELSLVLARAFEEDPFMSWMFPEPNFRLKLLQAWMRVEVESAIRMSTSWASKLTMKFLRGPFGHRPVAISRGRNFQPTLVSGFGSQPQPHVGIS